MNIGIVGNRKGWDYDFVLDTLEQLGVNGSDVIISGGAEGIDSFAQGYAKIKGAEIIILYPKPELPSPDRYFKRNQEIALRSDVLIAFDKGNSEGSGTQNTINHAKKLGKGIIVIEDKKPIFDKSIGRANLLSKPDSCFCIEHRV